MLKLFLETMNQNMSFMCILNFIFIINLSFGNHLTKSVYRVVIKCFIFNTAQPKSERQLEKHMKPPPKCISKANKKTSNRLISARKDKSSGRAADMSPLLPVEGNAEGSVEPRVETSNIPVHKLFQRTLSPADVLHVHSYAKGDYGEEILVQEEEQAIRSDKKEDTKHVSSVGICASTSIQIIQVF